MTPQFTTVKSLVDAPFFSELSKYKLEKAKLDTQAVALTGFVTLPLSTQRHPTLRLTSESFKPPEDAASPNEFQIPGKMLNTNTMDEFRVIDKIGLLKSQVKLLAAQIMTGEALKHPELLTQFLFLTFADLKKYRYYYWFMFPAFKWTSKIKSSNRPPEPDLETQLGMQKHPVCLVDESNGSLLPLSQLEKGAAHVTLGVIDYGTVRTGIPWHLRNVAALLSHLRVKTASIHIYHRYGGSRWIFLEVGELNEAEWQGESAEGWERNAQNRLVPKLTDLSSLMNPVELANQAVDLNLKLMKWRAAPQIDLEAISTNKCLLLGAGTLGSYVARGLMAWGVRHITFVDSGKVSYSNPVRQPLYTHENCIEQSDKAEAAANALKQIFPGINSEGHMLEIPMAGHPITSEERQHQEYEQLVSLIQNHDTVFLLMDSRESRWLPTVICQALEKTVINVALGFDSYLVMRHGAPSSSQNLGCYFCSDVVAPADSISLQTLDQLCTVTRPGCAMVASGYAVELFAQVCQHPAGYRAPANASTVLGPVPHQLRGFLNTQDIAKLWSPAFESCSACGPSVQLWKNMGWEFVVKALNDPLYVTEASGLGDLQRRTEDLELDSDSETEMY